MLKFVSTMLQHAQQRLKRNVFKLKFAKQSIESFH